MPPGDWEDRPTRPLSPLERQLMGLFCSGLSLQETAERAGVSPGVARNRRHFAYQKLAAHDLEGACARLAMLERVRDDPSS